MMNLYVLDKDFKAVGIVDGFISMIWNDRYNDAGDFELYISAYSPALEFLKQDYYLTFDKSEHTMIIETIIIETDIEDGSYAKIQGHSLEYILSRRIVWNQTVLSGNLQNALKTLINDAIISPAKTERQISNFIFKDSDDPVITALTIDTQYTGDSLFDVVSDICNEAAIGFKITLDSQNRFVFELYTGRNRTYDQYILPYVIFSSDFDNLLNSNYLTSIESMKTVTLVAGEDKAQNRKTIEVYGDDTMTGLYRRELYTDARDVRSEDNQGNPIPDATYYAQLTQRGKEDLLEYKKAVAFEGEAETSMSFKYGTDFFMGDIIQVRNEFGIQGKVRITEFVSSEDANGYKEYPTFTMIEEE